MVWRARRADTRLKKTKLEQLLGRGVDLVEPAAVRNPYLLAGINRHRELVYVA